MGESDELSGGEGDWWWEAVEDREHVHMPRNGLRFGQSQS